VKRQSEEKNKQNKQNAKKDNINRTIHYDMQWTTHDNQTTQKKTTNAKIKKLIKITR